MNFDRYCAIIETKLNESAVNCKMKTDYLAHINDKGDTQTVEEHLRGTAALCKTFAGSFDASMQGDLIGMAHDIGKCSAEFQHRLQGGKIVDHASAGALECAKRNALWAACCVAGHHGGLPDVGNLLNDLPDTPTLYGRLRRAAEDGIPVYEMPVSLPPAFPPNGYGKDHLTNSYIIRMLYSCLVDADYLDTERFMEGGHMERGTGDDVFKLLEKLDHYIAPWRTPTNELNHLRCEILQACTDGGRKKKGIYTLTVPTGGGKTVSSMAFALHHAAEHKMDRVIYVIPYTSIIEQTAEVFRKIFGAENVVEHHSGVSYEVGEGDRVEKYQMVKASENWDAPIIVTTSVQFFESLYANRPSKCRKLHNIANSVVIFDEAQMLPAEQLRPCTAAIAKLAEHFGVTALLCTATQPFLNDLLRKFAPDIRVEEICPKVQDYYTKFQRVTFEDAGILDENQLTDRLSALPQVLCVVNSRKAAQSIYKKLPSDGSYHLSTLMVPAHRRIVLAEIRDRLVSGLPCRVVSTSLIEAGVDVDFPVVFREMAGLDSILQAAGRCNREGKRSVEKSVVTVFRGISVTPQMLKVNIGAAMEALQNGADPADPETVSRYFKAFRSLAGDRLDKSGVIKALQNGIQGCLLPFKTVAERFHMIDDATKTVYIPVGDGEHLVRHLKEGDRSRTLFRQLGQYSVNIYERQYNALMASGCLEPLDDDSAILIDLKRYDRNLGLYLCDNENIDPNS